MNPVKSYLSMPDFGSKLVGQRWSNVDNGLEFENGTFTFAEEIADFLEGFAHVRRIVHFAFVVRLLIMLRRAPNEDEDEGPDPARLRLWKLFKVASGSPRSAGAFCGQLCHDVPAAREANQVADICRRLRAREPLSQFLTGSANPSDNFIQVVALGYEPPELPPLDLAVFEGKVLNAFQTFSDEEAIFWFKHGRAPLDESAAAKLAQAVRPTLSGRLASVLTRARLTRARGWVAQLHGALSLPPRKLAHQDLPLGGYSDVTTHGQVDQILPSQFALDEWDFFRRFAERELLYFRREDPREESRQELVVLLDQGVRTWGDVRLVLGAALLALGKQAAQRGWSFLLATNSVDIIDPLDADEDLLGELVEASDLSEHPGLALERVLEQPSNCDRDIVLLTHPRNLEEEDLRAAARRLHAGSRLFALTLDRHGQAELNEFKHGTPIAIRQFRIDFAAAPAETVVKATTLPEKWTGDVEPIGFPFRFGVGGRIFAGCFDFDVAGRFLLTVGPHQVLHLWGLHGNLVDMLPRAMWQGMVLPFNRPYVLGVANGFVMAGWFGQSNLAVHIDYVTRKINCHPMGVNPTTPWCLHYSPVHHCLISAYSGGGLVIDLDTGERFATNLGGNKSRAQDAWDALEKRQVPTRFVPVTLMSDLHERAPSVWVAGDTGTVLLKARVPRIDPNSGIERDTWGVTFTPLADGLPMLRKYTIAEAQLGDEVLALRTNESRLHLMRTSDGVPLGEYRLGKTSAFRLSTNGSLLARQLGDAQIEIRQVAGNIANLGSTTAGGFMQELPFILGRDRLMILPGRHAFLLEWSSGKLKFTYHTKNDTPVVEYGIAATSADIPEPCRYDTKRWVLGARSILLAASDCYGQLALFDSRQNLICMFFAFRTRLAGWMPDGTSFDHVSVMDGAMAIHFGRALCMASRPG